MTEAIVTLPDGRRAKITGPNRDAVLARVDALRAEHQAPQKAEEIAVAPSPGKRSLPTLQDRKAGALETAANLVSGAFAVPAGGLAGLGTLALTGDLDAATDVSERTTDALTFEPRTGPGEQQLDDVASTIAPIVEPFNDAKQASGDATFDALGRDEDAALAGTATQVAFDAALMSLPVVGQLLRRTGNRVLQSKRQEIGEKIRDGSTDNDTARFLVDGADQVKKDPLAQEAIKQGFDEGAVAAIKGATDADRMAMLKMANRLDQGKKNARFAAENRPADIVGDQLKGRVAVVKRANARAGRQLEIEANKLKGQQVDFRPAVDQFLEDLRGMGIEFRNGKLDFQGSDLEGLRGPQAVLRNVVERRMLNTKVPDAFDVHRMKRFIDEQVTFGKTQRGLSGRAEVILKDLRRNLDGVLDETFPSYNQTNINYAETIRALDAFQDIAGSKVDLFGPNADKSIGRLSRRIMSNAQSRERLLDAIGDINATARKHGASVDTDIVTQAMFVDELERVFGASAKTSLQGDVEKAATRAARDGVRSALVDAATGQANKLRGVSEKAAIVSIKRLLARQSKRPGSG